MPFFPLMPGVEVHEGFFNNHGIQLYSTALALTYLEAYSYKGMPNGEDVLFAEEIELQARAITAGEAEAASLQ